ncbi:MAG TPA: M20/M25/M40 family metallo-hydrolase [Gaiellaceae bacterium]|nr:M20/M25/M40 family metallo-hydrolase [Gaiellaceae bacterium]
MQRKLLLLLAAALTALVLAPLSSTAVGTDTTALRNAVTVAGVMEHEAALQAIADANGGTRASGTPGYAASVDYVADLLTGAGYEVTVQNFTYDQFVLNSSAFERVSPDPKVYAEGLDAEYSPMDYSGAGDFTAPLALAGGITIPSPGGAASGCSAADFAGFPAGAIALVQRGTCTFRLKAENAQAAGAVAVVIFNEGNDDPNDDRLGVIAGTLDPPQMSLPVIGTSFAVGEELYNRVTGGQAVTVRVAVDAETITTATANVLADTPTGRADRTVLVGAHLDSVDEGPGIQDNGSGTSAILETALQMAELGIEPVNRVRFAFWGAEEDGLIGSQYYVDHLAKRDLKDIALNLNHDMVGSPNFVRFVYDGDGSAFGVDGPSGSGHIESVFVDYFTSQGLATEPTEFDGRSDYDAFINAGIPAGGLFTGAEGIKTAEQAAIYGGTAGVAYDPCYHLACDTIANVNTIVLGQMSDAIAHSTLIFAMTKSSVNGTDKASNTAKEKMAYHGSKLER